LKKIKRKKIKSKK